MNLRGRPRVNICPLDVFSKLTKFSANCHIANDWSCFVEHKLSQTSDSPALVVLWCSSGLISQKLWVQIPANMENFLIFKNYLCKFPIGNKLQLGKKLYCLCRVLVNGVKTQVLRDREKEKARIAEDKRKQDEHHRIISGAGGFPPVPNAQASAALNHWQNVWSRKYNTARPTTSNSVIHFRPDSKASTGTDAPYYPLAQKESRATMGQNSGTNLEPGSTSSKTSVISKMAGFKNIAERLKASNHGNSVNLPSLKLMSGGLGEGAASIAEAKKKPKKKRKKTKKK